MHLGENSISGSSRAHSHIRRLLSICRRRCLFAPTGSVLCDVFPIRPYVIAKEQWLLLLCGTGIANVRFVYYVCAFSLHWSRVACPIFFGACEYVVLVPHRVSYKYKSMGRFFVFERATGSGPPCCLHPTAARRSTIWGTPR